MSDDPIIPLETVTKVNIKIKKPVKLELDMSDEIRERFEAKYKKSDYIKWNNKENRYRSTRHSSTHYDICRHFNTHLAAYVDGHKSRNPELKELTEKLWDSDQLVDMLNHEKEGLKAENKKLREALEHIAEYWNGGNESAVNAMIEAEETVEEALKDGE